MSGDGTSFGSPSRPSANATRSTRNSATGPKRSSLNHPFRGRSGSRTAWVPSAATVSGTAMSLDGRIDLGRTLADLVNRQPTRLFTRHSWSALGHAGERDAGDLRFLGQQPVDDFDRNVTANDIAADQRQVAGLQAVRNAVFLAHRRQIVGRDDLHVETVAAKVIGIAFAAVAFRVLVQRHLSAAPGRLGI